MTTLAYRPSSLSQTTNSLESYANLHRFAFVATLDGDVLWASDELVEFAGPDTSLVGRPIHELLPDLDMRAGALKATALSSSERLLLSQNNVRLGCEEESLPSVDINLFRVPSRLDATEEADDLIVAALRPVGPRRSAESSSSEAVGFLHSVLENAPDAVVAVDRFGFITYANRALALIVGQQPEELIDKAAILFLPSATDLGDAVSEVRSGGELVGAEINLKRPDGSSVWLSISSKRLRLPDGQSAGTVAFLRDVTEKRQIQERLERKNAELESYVHSVSHDLRSPLVSLLGFSRLLRQDYGALLGDTGEHFIDRIEQAGRTMEALIHDLLELSRIGQGGERRTWVDPRAVLVQLRAELKLRLDEKKVNLYLPADPPPVYCDRTRLYQVLSNLIGNALNHMGPCDNPHISVEISEEPDCHRISVRDNGQGIREADRERIFDAFTSLGSQTNGGYRSTGIGLAIVRKIAETHDGRVWVESTLGEGACFNLTLPRD